ncbi:60S acidic ribosomal protein P1-like protein, partial [Tanacetum coccineum]
EGRGGGERKNKEKKEVKKRRKEVRKGRGEEKGEAEKIATILKAANVECESYWPSLFAKLAEKIKIEDLIVNVGAGAGGSAAAVAPAVEEKKVQS